MEAMFRLTDIPSTIQELPADEQKRLPGYVEGLYDNQDNHDTHVDQSDFGHLRSSDPGHPDYSYDTHKVGRWVRGSVGMWVGWLVDYPTTHPLAHSPVHALLLPPTTHAPTHPPTHPPTHARRRPRVRSPSATFTSATQTARHCSRGSRSTRTLGRPSRWSGRQGAASRPCSACSSGFTTLTKVPSRWTGSTFWNSVSTCPSRHHGWGMGEVAPRVGVLLAPRDGWGVGEVAPRVGVLLAPRVGVLLAPRVVLPRIAAVAGRLSEEAE